MTWLSLGQRLVFFLHPFNWTAPVFRYLTKYSSALPAFCSVTNCPSRAFHTVWVGTCSHSSIPSRDGTPCHNQRDNQMPLSVQMLPGTVQPSNAARSAELSGDPQARDEMKMALVALCSRGSKASTPMAAWDCRTDCGRCHFPQGVPDRSDVLAAVWKRTRGKVSRL